MPADRELAREGVVSMERISRFIGAGRLMDWRSERVATESNHGSCSLTGQSTVEYGSGV